MHRGVVVVLAVLAGLLAFMGWRLNEAHQAIGSRDRDIAALSEKLSDKNGQLLAVDMVARMNDAFQASLQRNTEAIHTAATERQAMIKGVIRGSEENARWADAPLPADVIRLQNRPALTGGAGYHAFLSGGDPLPAPGKQPDNQR
ncbi:Rz-like lysis system protein LysB [Atlantibacter hermannii]|uniref:Rz-like lysis system protein LysB n=1 Tax=Atlantibacter hermannii TaxID=565 RepID=UPI0028AE1790|nr:Rz-like lysis system protein LysB [Atlantibacter hermannii]